MVGIVPHSGPQLIDGDFVVGVANGLNSSYSNGNTAAGSTAATALPIPSGIYYFEVDTNSGSPAGVTLPFAQVSNPNSSGNPNGGTELSVLNNTGTALVVYANPATNPATGSTDSINAAAASFTVSANSRGDFACAKNGRWIAR